MEEILNLVVTILLIKIAWTDYKTMEIPDKWNFTVGICGVVSIYLNPGISVLERMAGALCISVPMYLLTVWIPGAFGGGDVKLTSAMGLYLGWKNVLLGTFAAILIGGLQALSLLATGKVKAGEGAHMTFGPALCLGFFLANWWGDLLVPWYFGLFY